MTSLGGMSWLGGTATGFDSGTAQPPPSSHNGMQHDDDDNSDKEGNGGARPGKRRRNRAVLSCSNCKSRYVTQDGYFYRIAQD